MTERRQAQFRLHVGSCLDLLAEYPDNHFDSVVCDPPYHLTTNKRGGSGEASASTSTPQGRARIGTGSAGFMGKDWDGGDVAFKPATWAAVMRVLKPGGHLLAFGGSRTFHRMMVAIEDGGFEVRDMIAWLYGSGFPKSMDASKAIDASLGLEREPDDYSGPNGLNSVYGNNMGVGVTTRRGQPTSELAKQWDGWGTSLKPAIEPICMARKPFPGTVAQNLAVHGVGAINIDGCRVPMSQGDAERIANMGGFGGDGWKSGEEFAQMHSTRTQAQPHDQGRWPANVMHDGSDVIVSQFPHTFGVGHSPAARGRGGVSTSGHSGQSQLDEAVFDTGSAARFFYCAKASMEDREQGLEDFELIRRTDGRSTEHEVPNLRTSARRNPHPTVKPVELMRWLVRLVTPRGGLVLDPFMGSGSTGKACMLEGFRFVGMDLTPEYEPVARARITWAIAERNRLDPFGFNE